jgi:hypothetical protein
LPRRQRFVHFRSGFGALRSSSPEFIPSWNDSKRAQAHAGAVQFKNNGPFQGEKRNGFIRLFEEYTGV